MRVCMTVLIPVEAGNQALNSGTLPKVMDQVMGQLNPEAAYFYAEDGQRCAHFYFDMQDSADIPSICEPFFQEFNAKVTISPAMNIEDLQNGLKKASFV
ncbi:MAG: hypothetical protein HOQ05_03055 [Corynebacteriales bacterium]|nr:hypothetical protein [Mycobacteriales bacterium]